MDQDQPNDAQAIRDLLRLAHFYTVRGHLARAEELLVLVALMEARAEKSTEKNRPIDEGASSEEC